MKAVSESLSVARSQLTARLKQPAPGTQPRRRRTFNDSALVEQIKQVVGALPSYGYRRVWGRLRRQHEQQALPPVNVKRVYRVMRDHDLLLERRRKQPGVARRHDGRVTVDTSNTRWCSDGFEFRCEDGEKLRVTFALDCCDREAISWVASANGYRGDDVRDVMLEAIEQRFGSELPASPVQWLSDNGSAYTAEQTRAFARQIGLLPLTTPVCSPQSNGIEDHEARLHPPHAQARSNNGPAQPGHRLRALQRGTSAQRIELPLTSGVQALGRGINLTGCRCPV